MENNKKQVVAPGKEESISLKENNVLATTDNKKKKTNQISLQKLDLGTTPINISSSNNFIDFNLIINLIKSRIKIVLAIIAVIFVFCDGGFMGLFSSIFIFWSFSMMSMLNFI